MPDKIDLKGRFLRYRNADNRMLVGHCAMFDGEI